MTTINVVVGDPQLQNGPIFQSSTYIGTIEENKEEGTAILSVSTTGIEVTLKCFGLLLSRNYWFDFWWKDGILVSTN